MSNSFEFRKVHKGFFKDLGHHSFELHPAGSPDIIASIVIGTPSRDGSVNELKISSPGSQFLREGLYEAGTWADGAFELLDSASGLPIANIVFFVVGMLSVSPGKPKDNGAPAFYAGNEGSYDVVRGPDNATVLAEIHLAWKDSDTEKGIAQFIELTPSASEIDPGLILLAAMCRAAKVSLM